MEIILLLLILLVSTIIQVIIHEVGHLVCGLLTGYTFVSFHILGLSIYKKNGNMHIHFSHNDVSGQTLLSPNFAESNSIPYFWYHAGGIVFNLVFSILFGCIAFLSDQSAFMHTFFTFLAIIGLFLAISGSIPLSDISVSLDAYNIRLLKKSTDSKRAFWRMLKIEEALSRGNSYIELPKEWFQPLDKPDYNNNLICGYTLYKIYWLIENSNFTEAMSLCNEIIQKERVLQSIKNSAICEREFCNLLISINRQIRHLPFSVQESNLKSRCNPLANYHVLYAQAKLVLKDEQKAQSLKNEFEKKYRSREDNGEIKYERKMFSFIDVYALSLT